jgi:hypothetical protein
MIINTEGVDYDDRLRKECASIKDLGNIPKIAALEDENKQKRGVTDEGISFNTISLITRKFLPHKRFLIIKAFEMYIKYLIIILVSKPDVIWLHNIQMAGLIPFCWTMKKFGFINKLIWDQHELPANKFFLNKFIKKLFIFLINACESIVVANKERRDFLFKRLGKKNLNSQFHVIENFVDQRFTSLPKGILPEEVKEWLRGKPYLLAQGGANPDRHLDEVVEAIINIEGIKLIVVGPYSDGIIYKLKNKWGNIISEKVYFTGFVPQKKLVDFIDHAIMSIILYRKDIDNCWLCAPNRLYQALIRRIPVIVGINPPMANLVNKYNCGVVLASDGSNVEDIKNGIIRMMRNQVEFNENTKHCLDNISWESQLPVFKNIMKTKMVSGV